MLSKIAMVGAGMALCGAGIVNAQQPTSLPTLVIKMPVIRPDVRTRIDQAYAIRANQPIEALRLLREAETYPDLSLDERYHISRVLVLVGLRLRDASLVELESRRILAMPERTRSDIRTAWAGVAAAAVFTGDLPKLRTAKGQAEALGFPVAPFEEEIARLEGRASQGSAPSSASTECLASASCGE